MANVIIDIVTADTKPLGFAAEGLQKIASCVWLAVFYASNVVRSVAVASRIVCVVPAKCVAAVSGYKLKAIREQT